MARSKHGFFRHFRTQSPASARAAQRALPRGEIRSGSYFVAVVLNGGGGTAVGVHILLKVRELLLRRAAADEHKARVLVAGRPRRGHGGQVSALGARLRAGGTAGAAGALIASRLRARPAHRLLGRAGHCGRSGCSGRCGGLHCGGRRSGHSGLHGLGTLRGLDGRGSGAAGVFLAGRSGVASGALTKCGSNLGWALLPRAGAFCSRRGRLLLLFGTAVIAASAGSTLGIIHGSFLFFQFCGLLCLRFGRGGSLFFRLCLCGAGFPPSRPLACCSGCVSACAGAAFGFLPRTGGSGRTGAGTPSHGWPLTTGILRRFSFSMPPDTPAPPARRS